MRLVVRNLKDQVTQEMDERKYYTDWTLSVSKISVEILKSDCDDYFDDSHINDSDIDHINDTNKSDSDNDEEDDEDADEDEKYKKKQDCVKVSLDINSDNAG